MPNRRGDGRKGRSLNASGDKIVLLLIVCKMNISVHFMQYAKTTTTNLSCIIAALQIR